jgi:hypothetical protein
MLRVGPDPHPNPSPKGRRALRVGLILIPNTSPKERQVRWSTIGASWLLLPFPEN